MSSPIKRYTHLGVAALGTLLLGGLSSSDAATGDESAATDDKRIVDCLLQGQIRKLGSTVYQAPPRPVKIPARDCEIRGGDFLVFDRGSYAASLGHWLNLAKQGDVEAQIYVGEIFERGMGREPDYAQAAVWYQKAAEAGHPVAQISLAQLYEKGLGVPQDPGTAEILYRQAFGPGVSDNVAIDPRSLDDPADRMLRLEQQLAKAQQDAASLEQQLATARGSLTAAETDLAAQQAREAALRERLDQAQRQADSDTAGSTQAALDDQQYLIAQLEAQIARNQSQISAYESEFERASELEARLKEQSLQFETVNTELRETRAALADSNARLSTQQQQFDEERRQLLQARQELDAGSNATEAAQQELEKQLREREARLAAQSATLESMRAEINNFQGQSAELQNRLADLRRENEELVQARSDAARYRDESQRLQAALVDTQAQLDALESRTVEAEQVTEVQAELDRVRAEAERYKTRLVELESAQASVADITGPEIQLIEPVAFNTRSNSSIPITTLEEQSIIGKVSAPAGLLSLMVNQQPTEVNANNVFHSNILLRGEETPVRITAIDSQGKRSEQIFTLINKALQQMETKSRMPNVAFGKFHALLIGNQNYSLLPDLETPIQDVDAIAKILDERYGFEVTVIKDGTREQIMDGMYQLLGKLTTEDNLLIYYAGHGEYVANTNRGVWLPTDANPQSPANWITNIEVSDYLKQIAAKQIVVIADSCYSGALTRSALINLRPGLTDEEYEAHLKRMADIRARVVLTSGGLAPVLDSANPGSRHSIFAVALIEILQQNETVLSAQDLGRTIAAKVSLAATKVGYEQEPQYAPLNHANHQGGDFFFVPET